MTVDPFHLGSLFALRSILGEAERATQPTILTVRPVGPSCAVALMPGSFNPPTAAHVLLAERARTEGFDRVIFLLARRTVGKAPSGMILEDRLMALRAIAEGAFEVGVCSHGLYADQAAAATRRFPGADIAFLVGSDKVLQIFDDRWYADRDASLERLFGNTRLVVAPRSDQAERLRSVLAEPRNRRFAERVSILRLHPAVGDLSSTRVRGLLRSGAEPSGLVPPVIGELLTQTRAFAAPVVVGAEEVDAYALRRSLVDLIWQTRGPEGAGIDLARLSRIALSPTEEGRRLRSMLCNGGARGEGLMDARSMVAGL